MTELEMKVAALIRCVPADVYERALVEVKRTARSRKRSSSAPDAIFALPDGESYEDGSEGNGFTH